METGMCVNSRGTGGANVHRERMSRVRNISKIVLAALLAASLFAAAAGPAAAALPAPNWMPGSPIMAGTQIVLLWMPVMNAVKYNIYLNGKKVAESVSIQHMMPSPEASGVYNIEIAAVDASGAEGAKSRPGVFKIVTVEPPDQLYVRGAQNSIQVRWDSSKGAVIYNLYRSEKQGTEGELLASVQGDNYTDTKVVAGKVYFYRVTAKDLSGKESARSKPARGELLSVKTAEVVKIEIKVVPTKLVGEVSFFGKNKVESYGDLKLGPDGFIYVVDAGQAHILKINPDTLDVEKKIGSKGSEPGKFERPLKMAFSSTGRIYVVDRGKNKVVVLDKDGVFQFDFPFPKIDAKEVIDGVPPQFRSGTNSPGGIAVDDKGKVVYVTDTTYNTLYRFDLDGKFLGFLGHGGDPDKHLAAPGDILLGKDGEMYVTESLSHVIAVIDLKSGEIKRFIGKRAKGFIGGFIGITGMSFDGAGNLVASDSGVHSIQVFDGKTGDYLYHFGEEYGAVDPEMKERALLSVQMPVGAHVDGKNRLIFMRGDKKLVLVREIGKK